MTYRAIGYWREPNIVWLPMERRFVQDGWRESWQADPVAIIGKLGVCVPDPRVLSYLRGGREFVAWRGLSRCRFECGIPDEQMGHRCLTDGAWVWPEGLAHYVEHHRLPLPQEFVETARANQGEVPDVVFSRNSMERRE